MQVQRADNHHPIRSAGRHERRDAPTTQVKPNTEAEPEGGPPNAPSAYHTGRISFRQKVPYGEFAKVTDGHLSPGTYHSRWGLCLRSRKREFEPESTGGRLTSLVEGTDRTAPNGPAVLGMTTVQPENCPPHWDAAVESFWILFDTASQQFRSAMIIRRENASTWACRLLAAQTKKHAAARLGITRPACPCQHVTDERADHGPLNSRLFNCDKRFLSSAARSNSSCRAASSISFSTFFTSRVRSFSPMAS